MKTLAILCSLVLVFATTSCAAKTTDPVSGEIAYTSLRQILEEIFKSGPADPWDPKGEFENTTEYEQRLQSQKEQYILDSNTYYQGTEARTFVLLFMIDELPDFQADPGYFDIPLKLTSYKGGLSEATGPDYQLFLPEVITEKLHLYNQYTYENGLVDATYGGLSHINVLVVTNVETAKMIRQASEQREIFLRIGIQFEFPDKFEGYRFLDSRYDSIPNQGDFFSASPKDQLQQEDLAYGANEGKIEIWIFWVELVDAQGNIYFSASEGLMPAQTPISVLTATLTPFPPVSTIVPTQKPEFTPSDGTIDCPSAPRQRMIVGQKGRVTLTPDIPLRVRSQPSTSANIILLIDIGKQFEVTDGPVCANNFVWWEIAFGSYSNVWIAEGNNDHYFIEPLP